MSTSKATPGPWEARKNHTTWIILGGDDWSVCSFYSDTERADADARLIAAAPELRDALRGMIELCDGTCPAPGRTNVAETSRALLARLDAEDK